MQCGFGKDDAGERQRALDAAMAGDVVDMAALAILADFSVTQHFIGRTGKLQVMRRHHRRDAGLFQRRKDRRGNVVIDVVGMGDVGACPVDQRLEVFCASKE